MRLPPYISLFVIAVLPVNLPKNANMHLTDYEKFEVTSIISVWLVAFRKIFATSPKRISLKILFFLVSQWLILQQK